MIEITIKFIIMICLLGACSYTDIEKKEISLSFISVFLGIEIIYLIVFKRGSLWQQCSGIIVGVAVLVYSKMSKGAIGEGDGYLLVATGLMLGWRDNIVLLIGALILAGSFSIFLLLFKKVNKKKEIPFAPFLLLTYIGTVII